MMSDVIGSCYSFSFTAIRRLARNDAYKHLLVKAGALPLLVKMAQKGNLREQAGIIGDLTFTTFLAKSADDKHHVFFSYRLSRKLFPFQSLFSEKNISQCRLLKFLPSILSVKRIDTYSTCK